MFRVVWKPFRCFHGELLDLVGGVTCLEERAELCTLNGLCRMTVGLPLVSIASLGCVDLLVVVATQTQVEDLLVGQVCNQFLGLRVLAEEVLADVAAVAPRKSSSHRRGVSFISWMSLPLLSFLSSSS